MSAFPLPYVYPIPEDFRVKRATDPVFREQTQQYYEELRDRVESVLPEDMYYESVLLNSAFWHPHQSYVQVAAPTPCHVPHCTTILPANTPHTSAHMFLYEVDNSLYRTSSPLLICDHHRFLNTQIFFELFTFNIMGTEANRYDDPDDIKKNPKDHVAEFSNSNIKGMWLLRSRWLLILYNRLGVCYAREASQAYSIANEIFCGCKRDISHICYNVGIKQ